MTIEGKDHVVLPTMFITLLREGGQKDAAMQFGSTLPSLAHTRARRREGGRNMATSEATQVMSAPRVTESRRQLRGAVQDDVVRQLEMCDRAARASGVELNDGPAIERRNGEQCVRYAVVALPQEAATTTVVSPEALPGVRASTAARG